MNIKEMLEMKLHDEQKLCGILFVMRVPGGWIYREIKNAGNSTSAMCVTAVFVPEPKLITPYRKYMLKLRGEE